jgi:hypothetical protein
MNLIPWPLAHPVDFRTLCGPFINDYVVKQQLIADQRRRRQAGSGIVQCCPFSPEPAVVSFPPNLLQSHTTSIL